MERMEALRARVSNRALAACWPLAEAELSARAITGVRVERVYAAGGYDLRPGGVAVVQVLGFIAARADEWDLYFGLSDYAAVVDRVTAALADPVVLGVMVEIDSCGGEAAGAFDCRDSLVAAKTAAGKPVWAIARETACSGAYLIASACDRVIATQTAQLGSIGVIALHCDQSAYDARLGASYTYIQAGAKKSDGNPHMPLSASALADIQADIDSLYAKFVTAVATSRPLDDAEIRAQEAAVYRGAQAVAAGLADEVLSFEAALTSFAAALDNPDPTPAPAPEPVPEPEPPAPDAATLRVAAEMARSADIAEIAATALRQGVTIDAAAAIRDGVQPDALRRSVLEELAARSEAAPLIVAAPRGATAGESALVRTARAAAKKKTS